MFRKQFVLNYALRLDINTVLFFHSSVTIVNINDEPAVSLDGEAPIVRAISISFTEGANPVTLAPNLVVVDPDPTAMIVR